MPRFALRLRWSPPLAFAAMLGAVLSFGSNFVISRYATHHGFRPEDLSAIRFLAAIPFVLPFYVRRGALTCAGLGWGKGILLAITSGAPMTLFMNYGLSLAPASHGAALGPGTVMLVGVLHGIVAARKLPPLVTQAGLVLVACGLCAVALSGASAGSSAVLLGDVFFFMSGLLWGFYPVLLHRWKVDPGTGAAVCVVVALPWAIPYILTSGGHLLDVPLSSLVFQTVFQGVNFLGGLWLWGNAVRILGPARTALFPPMIPVIGTLVAAIALGEIPPLLQAIGVVMVVSGVLAANLGASLAMRRAREAAGTR